MNSATQTSPTEDTMMIPAARLSRTTLTIVLDGWNYVITNRGTATAYSHNSIFKATIR